MISETETVEVPDGHFERCRWLTEQAKKHGNGILDIGCSDGFMFRDLTLSVVEADLIYAFPEQYKGKIKFVKTDALHLPFKDNSFKCTILGDMLEHVEDPVRVLREVSRVSKHAYISVPNEWEWDETKRPFQHSQHIRFYTLYTLISDLERAFDPSCNITVHKARGGGWSFFCVECNKV
ncbi:MAG: class I SAM-dependent methyltransferase [Desulfocapsaceae bacterium]|nr:class I SAM-dependent methyltransferase [Desulfocapsaceae bacterium]